MPSLRLKRGLSPEKQRLGAGWEREERRLRIIKTVFSISLLVLIVVVAMVLWLILTHRPTPPQPSRPYLWEWQDTVAIQRAGGRLLGEHLRRRHEQARVLVLTPEPMEDIYIATLEGLLAALDSAAREVVVEKIPMETQNGLPSGHSWLAVEAFDQITAVFPRIDVVVSIAGLPRHPQKMQFWRRRPRPELMLINVAVFRLAHLIRAGGIAAVAIRTPGYVLPEEEELDPEAGGPWIIVTADNLSRIRRSHPNLFVSEGEEERWQRE